jgi:hypothetical protein
MEGAKQYLKKPVIVLAKQMDRDFMVQTANGLVKARAGDYLVKAPDGDSWPVAQEIFERTYELAPEGV